MKDKSDKPEDHGDNLGLWESILKEVATEKRNPDATLLVLGRAGVGKRTLLQALFRRACASAAAEDDHREAAGQQHSRAVGLDYAYFGARDPDQSDDSTDLSFVCPSACSALILEDPRHEKLLTDRLNLSMDAMRHCSAMICLDLKEPWTMMEDLRQWLELMQRISENLMQRFDAGSQDELRARITNVIEQYREPTDAAPEGTPTAPEGEEAPTEGVVSAALGCNLGIPLIVVVTRADGASALETQKTVGWSETIEAFVRNECLSYGAAIVYTMVQAKNMRNMDVLYDYLMHRLFDYSLSQKPCLPSRDALFVPSGFDTEEKVAKIVAQLPGGLERPFESVVVSLEAKDAPPAQTDDCEDMDTFLKHSAVVLQKLGGVSATGKLPGAAAARSGPDPAAAAAGARQPDGKRKSNLPLDLSAPRRPSDNKAAEAAGGAPAAAPGAAGAAGTDNSSLANFFQTLLTRGKGEGGGAGAPGGRPSAVPGAPAAAAGGGEAAAAVSFKVPDLPKKPAADAA